jgi:hypothetical protein
MYDRFSFTVGRYISFIFVELCYIILGSLGCERSAQKNIRIYVASAKSVHLNLSIEFRGERARRAHQDRLWTQDSLKVTKHLGVKTVQRRYIETKLLKVL